MLDGILKIDSHTHIGTWIPDTEDIIHLSVSVEFHKFEVEKAGLDYAVGFATPYGPENRTLMEKMSQNQIFFFWVTPNNYQELENLDSSRIKGLKYHPITYFRQFFISLHIEYYTETVY